MKVKLYKQENYSTGSWSGGVTRELAIYPESANYLNRDFIWRLSSASSDKEESSFTKLPDYDRILMVLEGDVVLAHGEERTVSLKQYEQDTFDGAVKTKCFGNLKLDYNLIIRKGCKGRMELIEAESESKSPALTPRKEADCDGTGGESASMGFFCREGYVVISVNGESQMVRTDQLLVIDCQPADEPKITVMGEGKCIFTEVIFDREEIISSDIFHENVRGGNFSAAFKLSFLNTRWAEAFMKYKGKGILYAPALDKKLKFLDRYMIPMIVWFIGLVLCLIFLVNKDEPGIGIAVIIGFSIVDILLITPLIYLIVLPKPIRAYMKEAHELNSYEKKLLHEQLSSDSRRDRLMYKYRDRSGEEYSSRRDFWGKMNRR